MFTIAYNVEFKKRTKRSKYDAERKAINDFLASEHENICFTYDDENRARNACQAIYAYKHTHSKPIHVKQRDNQMIIVRR